MDTSIEVPIPHSKCIRERTQHDTALNKIVKLETSLCDSIETGDDKLTERHGDSKTHFIVGGVEFALVNVPGFVAVIAIKHSLPLVDVLPEFGKFVYVNRSIVVFVKKTCVCLCACGCALKGKEVDITDILTY